ncbi:MAG: hypothetical protein CYG59_16385 [Chloroflexi bacterium]|nr:MAG: hypothetical protein CYG59_16385 [Chloroflexota bacterium]
MLRRLFRRTAKPSRYYLQALAIIEDRGDVPDVDLTHHLLLHDPVVSFVARCAEDLLLYRQAHGIPVGNPQRHDKFSAQLEAQFQHMLIDELARVGQKDAGYAMQIRTALLQRILPGWPTTK